MVRRWIIYLATLCGLIIFYWAYQEWFSWLALTGILYFPVVVLLMSLPAMLFFRLKTEAPAFIPAGQACAVKCTVKCLLPAPPYSCRIHVKNVLTGETVVLKEGQLLPTGHCGQLLCRPERARVYDYLGLFHLGIYKKTSAAVMVRPQPVHIRNLPRLEQHISAAWRPKAGGGYAENHELRLYRPGDSLNQIHWKLSVKTGKYIIREPQEPEKGSLLLNLELRGTPDELNRMLGRFLWLSEYLLERGLHHKVRALTGSGTLCLPVTSRQELEKALDTLLCAPRAAADAVMEDMAASWQYRIGGGEDEGQ